MLESVTGRRFASRPAVLADFARYALRARSYPALVPEPGASTEGRLVEGLDARAWSRLDAFEGALYDRLEVHVSTATGRVAACAYVLRPSRRDVLGAVPWDAEAFLARRRRG